MVVCRQATANSAKVDNANDCAQSDGFVTSEFRETNPYATRQHHA